MQLIDVSFEKCEFQTSQKKLNLTFSETVLAHLHKAPRRHAPGHAPLYNACAPTERTRHTVGDSLQRGVSCRGSRRISKNNEVHFSGEKLKFSSCAMGLARLHTPLHHRPLICLTQKNVTQLSHLALCSSEGGIPQYLEQTVCCELIAARQNVQSHFSTSQIPKPELLNFCPAFCRFFACLFFSSRHQVMSLRAFSLIASCVFQAHSHSFFIFRLLLPKHTKTTQHPFYAPILAGPLRSAAFCLASLSTLPQSQRRGRVRGHHHYQQHQYAWRDLSPLLAAHSRPAVY